MFGSHRAILGSPAADTEHATATICPDCAAQLRELGQTR
jgi:hypothetical protein